MNNNNARSLIIGAFFQSTIDLYITLVDYDDKYIQELGIDVEGSEYQNKKYVDKFDEVYQGIGDMIIVLAVRVLGLDEDYVWKRLNEGIASINRHLSKYPSFSMIEYVENHNIELIPENTEQDTPDENFSLSKKSVELLWIMHKNNQRLFEKVREELLNIYQDSIRQTLIDNDMEDVIKTYPEGKLYLIVQDLHIEHKLKKLGVYSQFLNVANQMNEVRNDLNALAEGTKLLQDLFLNNYGN